MTTFQIASSTTLTINILSGHQDSSSLIPPPVLYPYSSDFSSGPSLSSLGSKYITAMKLQNFLPYYDDAVDNKTVLYYLVKF